MDNGIPFTTEPNALMEMIPPPNILKKFVGGLTGQSAVSGNLPDGQLSNTPWRKMGVKYATNEIYFDIIEEIDCTVDANGLVVSSEVSGEIQSVCKLSGMPDLTLSFTNPHILDDVSFHPCVRYNRYEQSKVISFVPPDGNFKLMNYRVKGQLQLPIYVKPQINYHGSSGRVSIMVGLKNTQGKVVEDVVITVQFPKGISSTTLTANQGTSNYDEMTKVCKWVIGKIPKDKSPMLEGSVSLPPGAQLPDTPAIIMADFKIVMYAASGLKVDSLSLHTERYKPYKGVRSITRAGKFQVRC
jgi:AP-3 complex subunit mu